MRGRRDGGGGGGAAGSRRDRRAVAGSSTVTCCAIVWPLIFVLISLTAIVYVILSNFIFAKDVNLEHFYYRILRSFNILPYLTFAVIGLALLAAIILIVKFRSIRQFSGFLHTVLLLVSVAIIVISVVLIRNGNYTLNESQILAAMENSILDYRFDHTISDAWDAFQRRFHCCGIDGPIDFFNEKQRSNQPYRKAFRALLNSKITKDSSDDEIFSTLAKDFKYIPASCYTDQLLSTMGANGCSEVVMESFTHSFNFHIYFFIALLVEALLAALISLGFISRCLICK